MPGYPSGQKPVFRVHDIAEQGYKISLLVLTNIFQHEKRNYVSPSEQVILLEYLNFVQHFRGFSIDF